MTLRWWPPLLHLILLAVVLPLALWRLDALQTTQALPQTTAQPATTEASSDPAASSSPPTAIAAVDLAAVTERPLFTKTRQGTQVAAPLTGADPTPAAPPAAQIRMVGFVNDGTRRSAILAFGDDPAEVVVAEGDEVVGMTIQKINPNSLVLMADGEEITIKMFDQ
jgi:hypothetical protein